MRRREEEEVEDRGILVKFLRLLHVTIHHGESER